MNTETDIFYISVLNITFIGVYHTILQIFYSLMMAHLKTETCSPVFSITNKSRVRRILTGIYYCYWVWEINKLDSEVISNGMQFVHSFAEIGQINQKFRNGGNLTETSRRDGLTAVCHTPEPTTITSQVLLPL